MAASLPLWIQGIAAFATPMVALAVAYIAYRQWKTARDKLRLDLFDKRFAVFMDVRKIASETMQDRPASDPALPQEVIARGRFLFGAEVVSELKNLQYANELTRVGVAQPGETVGDVYEKLIHLMEPYLKMTERV